MVEGVGLENQCSVKTLPWVRIPPSPQIHAKINKIVCSIASNLILGSNTANSCVYFSYLTISLLTVLYEHGFI